MTFSQGLAARSYRILALGVAFFIVGGIFFLFDARTKHESTSSPSAPAYIASHTVQEPQKTSQPLFAGYPPSSTFTHVAYTEDVALKDNVVLLKGACSTPYIAILMFSVVFDYREDPTKAVVNRSIPCPENKQFSYSILFHDLKGIAPGTYYAFVADQQEGGVWYNPR